jgi:hypothetical protein
VTGLARTMAVGCAWALVFVGCAGDPPNLGGECSFQSGGCDDGLVCIARAPAGYCSSPCSTAGSSSECPTASMCGTVCPQDAKGWTKEFCDALICLKTCKSAEDCRRDQNCVAERVSGVLVCLPKP